MNNFKRNIFRTSNEVLCKKYLITNILPDTFISFVECGNGNITTQNNPQEGSEICAESIVYSDGMNVNENGLCTPPISFSYSVSSGTQACIGGYIDISSPVTITVYSTVHKDDWIAGTQLYSDAGLTTLITATFIRSTTGGTIGTIFADMSTTPGIIDSIIFPMTGC